VDVERHGGHRERGAGGDGGTVRVADGEVFGADPAGELVAFADGEVEGGGANDGVGVLTAGLDPKGAGGGVVDGGIGRGGAVKDGEVVEGRLVDGGRCMGGDGGNEKG